MPLFTIWEILQIAITIVVVGFIFSAHIRKPRTELEDYLTINIWEDIKYAAIVAAPAVILHELMHKFVALGYGFSAHYVASWWGLAIGALLKIIGSGFIFFLPGYVSISGMGTAWQFGLTALAGPLTNLILFLISWIILERGLMPKYAHLWATSKQINLWLFAFNMLPIPGLDGLTFYLGLLSLF
ncbi:MAG: hypothetical protein HY438_03065 [DPANN group archaeon]|nr:hypothetical protein [DPANN group archaeon]